MASLVNSSIVLILLVSITVNRSVATLTKYDLSKLDLGYESDYEMGVKNSNGKIFIAYIIEQGDMIVKKKCICTPMHKCSTKNMIKLSK